MEKIRIVGGNQLNGNIKISGAKNAALPLMTASILTNEPLNLVNVPNLKDIRTMSELLFQLGVEVSALQNNKIQLKAASINDPTAKYDLVKQMRASVLVLGPLVAKIGQAKVSMPGGCAIGLRPVDFHIKGLEELGASISMEDGYINASAPNGLIGTTITFPIISVTGTENILMAATLAKGRTTIINAALEPEVSDLANCLNKMGAKITGQGTSTIIIEGVTSLHGTEHEILPDRIEAGSYAIAAGITNGKIELLGRNLASLMPAPISVLENAGCEVIDNDNKVIVNGTVKPKSVDITTDPFPGFATDLQAQMMAFLCLANGSSVIKETIWENRFMHVPELMRMGANITAHGSIATIRGVEKLYGAQVMATDLRASFSLVLAGLIAEGETIVDRVYHLDRGYESVEKKLSACGANIERI